MRKTGALLTILLLLCALLLPLSNAMAATDGYYNLGEVTPTWDGTDADRNETASADYSFVYGLENSLSYTLPWSFSFYGQSYNQITIDTNGNLWFAGAGAGNSFNLAATGAGPVVAAWNCDLSSIFVFTDLLDYLSRKHHI